MAATLHIDPFLAWPEPSGERPKAFYSHIPSKAEGIATTLAYFLFAPEKLGSLYTHYYIRDGFCFSDPAPPLAAASPSDQLALIRDSFGFTVTKISDIFGKTRPTIYQWMKDGPTDPKALKKLTTLASAGDYWKTRTVGVDRAWLLEQSSPNTPSIMDEMKSISPVLRKITALMDLRLSEYHAATARAKEILGENGVSQTMSQPNTLTAAQQMSDRTWTRIRENLSAASR
jgi:hypothetical protein